MCTNASMVISARKSAFSIYHRPHRPYKLELGTYEALGDVCSGLRECWCSGVFRVMHWFYGSGVSIPNSTIEITFIGRVGSLDLSWVLEYNGNIWGLSWMVSYTAWRSGRSRGNYPMEVAPKTLQ